MVECAGLVVVPGNSVQPTYKRVARREVDMQRVKVVISGAFNAGKTQFIETITEIAPVRTERRVTDATQAIKTSTTAAMDYGRVTLNKHVVLHLYGTPGQRRFDFMWTALSRGMHALLIMVDSTCPEQFGEAQHVIDFFAQFSRIPCLVVANKQDHPAALCGAAIHQALGLPVSTKVVPCVAVDRTSVQAVLHALVALLEAVLPIEPPIAEIRCSPSIPIQPHAPALLAAVALDQSSSIAHLTTGDGSTLCGAPLSPDALPVHIFGSEDCTICDRRAWQLRLICVDCGRPLTRSNVSWLCPGCEQQRAARERDAYLADLDR